MKRGRTGLLDRLPLLLFSAGTWLPTWQRLRSFWFLSRKPSRKLFCIQFDGVKHHSFPLYLENTKPNLRGGFALFYIHVYIYMYIYLFKSICVSISKDVERGKVCMGVAQMLLVQLNDPLFFEKIKTPQLFIPPLLISELKNAISCPPRVQQTKDFLNWSFHTSPSIAKAHTAMNIKLQMFEILAVVPCSWTFAISCSKWLLLRAVVDLNVFWQQLHPAPMIGISQKADVSDGLYQFRYFMFQIQ